MKRRLRNYISVVITLSLCLGLWFQWGQPIRATEIADGTKLTHTARYIDSKDFNIWGEVTYTQSGEETEGKYEHPENPVAKFGDSWKKEDYFFAGWGVNYSGGVVDGEAPDSFTYGTDSTFYAKWQKIRYLDITYKIEEEEANDRQAQKSIADTNFIFNTKEAPSMKGKIFDIWEYELSDGNKKIGAKESCTIPIDMSMDSETATQRITFTAKWTNTPKTGTYNLSSGSEYTLGEGSWKVSKGGTTDNCIYSAQSSFYVSEDGEYSFSQ